MIGGPEPTIRWGESFNTKSGMIAHCGFLEVEGGTYRVAVSYPNNGAKIITPEQVDGAAKKVFAHFKEVSASKEPEFEFKTYLKSFRSGAEVLISRMRDVHFETPNWEEMRRALAAVQSLQINQITKSELKETLETLATYWDEIGQCGQWDQDRGVLHLRRNPGAERTWPLPRSVEIHTTPEGVQIYVLHKGRIDGKKRTPKLGEGGFKEVARSVNLQTLKGYVHATIDLRKKAIELRMLQNEIRALTITEIGLQGLFKGDDEFVHIAGWTEYINKAGFPKIGITMDLCNAGDLFEVLDDKKPTEITTALVENINNFMQVITDMTQMLLALEREKIINRDIKLENIFVEADHNLRLRAKMSDFGLARIQDDAIALLRRNPGMLAGSLDYVAPEYPDKSLTAEQRSTFATHIWQMGVALHAILTGRLPKLGETAYSHPTIPGSLQQGCIHDWIDRHLKESNPDVPRCVRNNPDHLAFLKQMVKDMLQVNPAERPSADALLARLVAFKASHPEEPPT